MTHDNAEQHDPEQHDHPAVRRSIRPRKGLGLLFRSRIGILLATSTFGVLGVAGYFGYEVSTANATTAASTPTVGTIPASVIAGGTMDASQIPDFVPVMGQGGKVVGYIKKQDLLMQGASPAGIGGAAGPTAQDQANQQARAIAPVYGPDLTTVIGHMYPNVGFVPAGASPPSGATVTPTTIVQQS